MTVGELIEKLSHYYPNIKVVVGAESVYREIQKIELDTQLSIIRSGLHRYRLKELIGLLW